MAESERLEDRNERWYHDYAIRGMTLRAIADREGYHISTVHEAIKHVRKSIPDETREARTADVLEFYAKVRQEAWRIADLPAAPIVARDGTPVIDPVTNEYARDYTGKLRALDTAMKTVEHERKVLGLDAAVKIDQTITDTAAAERVAREARARLEGAQGDGQ
jgi:hypothetical protein